MDRAHCNHLTTAPIGIRVEDFPHAEMAVAPHPFDAIVRFDDRCSGHHRRTLRGFQLSLCRQHALRSQSFHLLSGPS